jgi:hypothetical protein
MGPDESGVPQQAVTPVPDQVRDDGPGVHFEGLKISGKRQFQKVIPKRSPPLSPVIPKRSPPLSPVIPKRSPLPCHPEER